jgi:hypothetical protein
VFAAKNNFAGHDAVGKNAAFVVNVAQEKIERGDALRQSVFDVGPFRAGDDAGQQIVGKDSLCSLFAAINGESDALIEKREVGGMLAAADFLGWERGESVEQRPIMLAGSSRAVERLEV